MFFCRQAAVGRPERQREPAVVVAFSLDLASLLSLIAHPGARRGLGRGAAPTGRAGPGVEACSLCRSQPSARDKPSNLDPGVRRGERWVCCVLGMLGQTALEIHPRPKRHFSQL